MTDMLVKLYDNPLLAAPAQLAAGVTVKHAMAADKGTICRFVQQTFSASPGWLYECELALLQQPSTCYVAVHQQQLIGFVCFDASARGMLGPIGIAQEWRGQGVGGALLCHCLHGMRQAGYAYAVIGWVSGQSFYASSCGATVIPDSFPGLYRRLVEH